MKVLVTGGTGLLGNTIVRQLAGQHEVKALVRGEPEPRVFQGVDVRRVYGDLKDADAVLRAVSGCDAVIHSAGLIHLGWQQMEASMRVNRDGVQHVVDACLKNAIPIVHVGTVNTLAVGSRKFPSNESTPLNREGGQIPCSYVISKRAGVEVIRSATKRGLRGVTVHPGFMLGPWDWKPSSGRMVIEIGKSWKPIAASGGCSTCDSRDVAAATISAMLAIVDGRIENGREYILAGENQTYRQLWTEMATRMGQRPPVIGAGPAMRVIGSIAGDALSWFSRREGDLNSAAVKMSSQFHWYDSSRAQRELGYQNRPLAETLDDAVRWLRENILVPDRGCKEPTFQPTNMVGN